MSANKLHFTMKAERFKRRHSLKTWPEYYKAVKEGSKTFEIRKNDRSYNVGDTLNLKEYNPDTKTFTGNHLEVEITYILEGGAFGLSSDYVCMGIKLVEQKKSNALENIDNVSDALIVAGKYDLECEVVLFALKHMKENKSSTIKDAVIAGLTEWDLI